MRNTLQIHKVVLRILSAFVIVLPLLAGPAQAVGTASIGTPCQSPGATALTPAGSANGQSILACLTNGPGTPAVWRNPLVLSPCIADPNNPLIIHYLQYSATTGQFICAQYTLGFTIPTCQPGQYLTSTDGTTLTCSSGGANPGCNGTVDACGVCNGNGSTCGGLGACNGTVDPCGVCNGNGSTCQCTAGVIAVACSGANEQDTLSVCSNGPYGIQTFTPNAWHQSAFCDSCQNGTGPCPN